MNGPLHMVHNIDALAACLARIAPHSALLLVEDAVQAALSNHASANLLVDKNLFVLTDDLARLNLRQEMLIPSAQVIEMAGFVRLACDYQPQIAWDGR
jgi:sulfur relay protein TusB/DsrH